MPDVSISFPTANGQFAGSANGTYSPTGGTIDVKFWRTNPTTQNPEPAPDAQAAATVDEGRLKWSAALDLSGVAATTTGYLRAIHTNGGQSATANVSPLTWTG